MPLSSFRAFRSDIMFLRLREGPCHIHRLPLKSRRLPPCLHSVREASATYRTILDPVTPPRIRSMPHYSDHNRPMETTMIQGTNVNIGYAKMDITNHQVNEALERRSGAHIPANFLGCILIIFECKAFHFNSVLIAHLPRSWTLTSDMIPHVVLKQHDVTS